jgi:hypothetical protein
MEYDNSNRGMLMRTRDKLSEKHPDYFGTLNVNGNALKTYLKMGKL